MSPAFVLFYVVEKEFDGGVNAFFRRPYQAG